MSDQTDLQKWVKVRIDNMDERVAEVLDHAERVLKNADSFRDLNLDAISKWQEANDKRHEELRAAHEAHIDGYNKHLFRHQRTDDYLDATRHISDHNAKEMRLHQALIIGAIALAAFALGRQS